MAASEDLIDFNIIEAQKENVQSLPGGRSARELARIFSGGSNSDSLSTPSPNDTRTLNGAIRQEYENELQVIGESDDPLDVYDRYVKWTLNAYPSAQATAESGLLPLLERATKSFLSSTHYKNDPRYLKLWLHYIRLFSDAPRETFAFLARHHIGEGLALFYEEFAAWLEGAGRWAQADEVFRLGVDREARPAERLLRKYSEFQHRYEERPQNAGPSSPALPAVRPALAAKMDPFSLTDPSGDQQASQPSPQAGATKTKSGKAKMAIFSDVEASSAEQPAASGTTKGWESIGSMRDRRKENEVEAKPWVGETLKAGKKSAPKEKMAIFRDESNSNPPQEEICAPRHIPEHHVREAVNPRTGRRERVFVDLESVYPDYKNPAHEVSFEELRAIKRGWMSKNWRTQKEPLKQISGNSASDLQSTQPKAPSPDENLPEQFDQKLAIDEQSPTQAQDGALEGKPGKARKFKVHGDSQTQTVKMKFDSPTNSKVRQKSTREPTMTMHTRAATDEIYSIFNQPLKAEEEDAADSCFGSDYDDDDCASTADTTGHISATSSDFGDDETQTFHKSLDDTEYGDGDTTHPGSVVGDDWTEFSVSRDVPGAEFADATSQSVISEGVPGDSLHGTPERRGFMPQMPEDYAPPCGTYRDPAVMAQNRLPFMTPIVERTESSISMTAARNALSNAKTPSRPRTPSGVPQMGDLLLSSPLGGATPYQGDHTVNSTADVPFSPTAFKALAPKQRRREVIIKEAQCNPTDNGIRNTILNSLEPPLAAYAGYHGHVQASNYSSMIQKFVKAHSRRSKSGDDEEYDMPILEFPGAERSYIIRRELGAGAYAPVYLAESVDSLESYNSDSEEENTPSSGRDPLVKKSNLYDTARYPFEAVKVENGPSSAWEFYMIRTAHERLRKSPGHSRATDSIVRAHELHVHQRESFLVEDYRGQGTLLDLVNILRNEPISSTHNSEGGLEESLAMFFSVELFRTIEALHANGILHGDIKADNCLVRLDDEDPPTKALSLLDLGTDEPSQDSRDSIYYSPNGVLGWRNKGLALIDFGRGIDMNAFTPTVQFIADWEVGTHECNEIREMRPWTHQIDLYGIAGVIHVLLFGKYIESSAVRTSSGTSTAYRIRESLKRYWDRELWVDVFDLLLNPGSEKWVSVEMEAAGENFNGLALPVLHSMRKVRKAMEDWLVLHAEKKGLALQLRKIEALLSERKKKMERS
ncbi:hypothetical protein N7476_003886 [Penicillium atrosanguineum]|uniref:Uncharacterized protein n=1 Tax=Penicillium atrosanguineum TaxID=1132637 RepID=A0A9W9PZ89_9EURO|nr:hypothetical protein N7526_003249 [Penicillium atrosanguineum]KAJ5320884.1 hypothetical protein N7476_003886 [Penicillium atrosanguineum]